MLKVGLEIKNGSKIFKPKKGDVVIFDGKEWYVTTKDDIFKEYQDKVDAKLAEVNIKVAEMEQYKKDTSAQIAEMAAVIKQFVELKGDK